ncbi:MAG: hypothetical protein CM1200mP24_04210 [Gammaproteobacteria bacterium]|nr:MAG: hypothetical protein CM1200mP24_04210 [Gammaproteobacteria bacterium]
MIGQLERSIVGEVRQVFSVPSHLKKILSHTALSSATEVTLEVNPGTIERYSFTDYRNAGITRASIGVQSFNSKQLVNLGRIHSVNEAETAISEALESGLKEVNIDLMYGLPQKNAATSFGGSSKSRCPRAKSHILVSTYDRTKNCFCQQPPTLPTLDIRADIDETGREFLQSKQYQRYEISAYAKDGKVSNHNINYWRFGDYLGIGAGAHGKYKIGAKTIRTEHRRQPRLYMGDGQPIRKIVPIEELPAEFMMNVLRLKDGVENERFLSSTGLPFRIIAAKIKELRDWELIQTNKLSLTEYGYKHIDSIVEKFLTS